MTELRDDEDLLERAGVEVRRLLDQGCYRAARRVLDACADFYLAGWLPGLLPLIPPGKGRRDQTAKVRRGGGGVACEWVARRMREAGEAGVDISELEAHMRSCPTCRKIKARVKRQARRELQRALRGR